MADNLRVEITTDAGNYLTGDVFDIDRQVANELVALSVATEVDPEEVEPNLEDSPAAWFWDRYDRPKTWDWA